MQYFAILQKMDCTVRTNFIYTMIHLSATKRESQAGLLIANSQTVNSSVTVVVITVHEFTRTGFTAILLFMGANFV